MKNTFYIWIFSLFFIPIQLFSQLNWNVQSFYSPVRSINISGSKIRVYKDNALILSSDYGNNWTKPKLFSTSTRIDINGYYIKDSLTTWIANYNTNTGYYDLYKTTNGGINWTIIYNHLEFLPSNKSIFFIDNSTGWVCGGTYFFPKRYILKTTNGGANWITQYQESLPNYSCNQNICMINSNTGFVTCGIDSFLVTRDGGANWIKKYCGIGTSQFLSLIDFINANTGFMINEYPALIKTSDGGYNWSAIPFSVPVPCNIYSMFFLNAQTGWVGGDYGYIFKTTNGGSNWITLIDYHGASCYSINSIIFSDANSGWIGDENGELYKTSNGGFNWSLIKTEPIGNFRSIGFLNSNTGFVINSEGKIWKTIDKGNTWSLNYSVSSSLKFLYPDTYGGCYISGNSGCLLFSSNQGANWSQYNMGSGTINEILFTSINTGWLVGDNGKIFKTINRGQNWVQIPSYTDDNLLSLSFINPNTGWIIGFTGKIFKTTNGGTSWDTTRFNEYLGAITFKNQNTGILSSAIRQYTYPNIYHYIYRIRKTTNGGNNWTLQYECNGSDNFQPFYPVHYIDSVHIWTVSQAGKYGVSNDDGNYWNISSYFTGLNSLFFNSPTLGWIAGNNIIMSTDEAFIGIRKINSELPISFSLEQNYPNPFNVKSKIRYKILELSNVKIQVFDITGRYISSLVDKKQNPGIYEVFFDGNNLPSGVYFYRIQAGDFVQVKRMVLIK